MRRIVIISLVLSGALAPRAAGDQIRLDHREGSTGNYAPLTLSTTPGYVVTFDAGGSPIIAAAPAAGVALGDSPTWTGAHTFSKAGAAAAPTISLTGTPFTGGTATTTKPLMLLEPTGTTSTGWSTSGTLVGVNAPSGFAGNLIDAQLNGAARFKVDSTGKVFFSANGHAFATNGTSSAILSLGGSNTVVFSSSAATASRYVGGITIGSLFADDCSLFKLGAQNLRLGASASATPLAQTLTIGEASRPGTDSNTAGANGTIQSGLGTGTGTASSLIFQTPTVAASGSATQTYATRLTLNAAATTFTGTVDMSAATVLLGTATGLPVEFCVAMSDETTAITTGTAKVTMRAPYAFTVTNLRASVNTVSSSGLPTVDINEAGTTIISTKLTIDASEKTSVTAAAAYVISDSAIADDAELTFDIDVAGTGAKGLKVWVYGRR